MRLFHLMAKRAMAISVRNERRNRKKWLQTKEKIECTMYITIQMKEFFLIEI